MYEAFDTQPLLEVGDDCFIGQVGNGSMVIHPSMNIKRQELSFEATFNPKIQVVLCAGGVDFPSNRA